MDMVTRPYMAKYEVKTTSIDDPAERQLQLEIFYDDWKTSFVIPCYNKKGSMSVITNNRPVSLVARFTKIFETVIDTYITDFLLPNNILDPNQLDFVPNKLITDQLHNFLYLCYTAMS